MPIPISPMNVRKDDDSNRDIADPADYSGINYDLLRGIIRTHNSNSNVKVSNSDASLLFKFWQSGKIEKVGHDEVINVPEKFSNNDILRLKALGFVVGDEVDRVKLTARAKDVIKTLVLNEENSFESARVHKPYNEILADNTNSGQVRLALDKKK